MMAKANKEDCLLDLKRRILTLELAPGSALDEASLVAQFGLSRTPLREVLQRLAGEGYAQITSNRGAQVASMDITVMRTFFQTAPMIYAAIARLAAESRRKNELEALKATQLRFRKAIVDRNTIDAALANHDFHASIGAMAKNPYLAVCLHRLLVDHTRLGHTFYKPAKRADQKLIEQATEQHDAMIDAFEAQNAEQAVQLTLQHWDLSRDRIERFVHPDPLPMDMGSVAHAL
ncbi:MAG: GntR family transcriptional regulator [Pseudomonadota bacterium]